MPKLYRYIIGLFLILHHFAHGQNFARPVFENSVLSGNYGYSLVSYTGYSWVENVKGRLPLSDSIHFTPPNALSLKYTSSLYGNWETNVYFPEQKSYRLSAKDQLLSFRIYYTKELNLDVLPHLALLYGDTCTQKISLKRAFFPLEVKEQEWLQIKIPVNQFGQNLENISIQGIVFSQGKVTGVEAVNHILIDQIEFIQSNYQDSNLSFPAVLNSVKAYERHVDIEWQIPLDPAIRYVKIFRSLDGKNFEAIAIRPIQNIRYTDILPSSNRAYHYKISWLDYKYNESPSSAIAKVQAEPMSDEELLTAIQVAHVNYFDKFAEFNSGMHKVNYFQEDAIVNVEETGYSLLASTVGVANGWISNRIYLRRINSIVDFLTNAAESNFGVYPNLLDGRSGKGVYDQDTARYVSLSATASMMQGLLVARSYLADRLALREDVQADENNVNDRLSAAIAGIDGIWKKVEWNRFVDGDSVLYDSWSPQFGFKNANKLGGFGPSMTTYFMAFASPTHPIPNELYYRGFKEKEVIIGVDSLTNLPLHEIIPFNTDTMLYGNFLKVGRIDQHLMETFYPFLAFNPNNLKDVYANYGDNLPRLIKSYKRRDNELNIGNRSADVWGTAQGREFDHQLPILEPAISLSSYVFTPDVAKRSARRIYEELAPILFTEFGMRTWINLHDHQISESYRALNQAAIPVMIENGRSGLIWNLFMNHVDIKRMTNLFFQSTE
jgi:hypothetical protein